jgi:hypothetical protein
MNGVLIFYELMPGCCVQLQILCFEYQLSTSNVNFASGHSRINYLIPLLSSGHIDIHEITEA